jgi:hypothetical protein
MAGQGWQRLLWRPASIMYTRRNPSGNQPRFARADRQLVWARDIHILARWQVPVADANRSSWYTLVSATNVLASGASECSVVSQEASDHGQATQ